MAYYVFYAGMTGLSDCDTFRVRVLDCFGQYTLLSRKESY